MLEKLKIAHSPLTDIIYVGTLAGRHWRQKRDMTSEIIGALMAWTPPGTIRQIRDNDGNVYEIEVRKVASTSTGGEHE